MVQLPVSCNLVSHCTDSAGLSAYCSRTSVAAVDVDVNVVVVVVGVVVVGGVVGVLDGYPRGRRRRAQTPPGQKVVSGG